MAMNDPLGDMLTRIRNAQMRRRPKVSTPASNMRGRVLDVLAEEGYIRGYTRVEQKGEIPEFIHDGLATLRSDGRFDEIYSSYFGENE